MKPSDHDNKNISELLIALHHGANVVSPDRFREYALDLVHSVIPFDSAIWGKHSRNGNELVASERYMHGQHAEMLQDMESICQLDAWLTEAQIVQPWITVNLDYSQPPCALTPEFRRYLDLFGLMHCLCTMGYDPLSQTPHYIVLGRNDLKRPFT